MLVFDKDGVAHDKEPIDAAECVDRLGWTREPPEPVPELDTGNAEDPATDAANSKKKTKGEPSA